jgi:3alpha(or 20beta)-hydroxysteroid dehydrogenase
MSRGLEGKVVLITGAARGMGAEHVRQLVAAGAKVVATDVLDEQGRALVAGLGVVARYQHHDVTSEGDWRLAVSLAESAFGRLDHLVNNAGILTSGSVEAMAPETFRRTLEVNLVGTFLGMHAAIPAIKRAGGGSIVNVASIAGLQGYANLGAYVASKWGIRGLTKSAALELGPSNIRVNLICPGPIRTPMIEGLGDLSAGQPIARIGEPAEVTAMLLFLLDGATYSTGHEFIVDGGAVVGRVLEGFAER